MGNTKWVTWAGLALAVGATAITYLQTHQIGGPSLALIASVIAALGKALGDA